MSDEKPLSVEEKIALYVPQIAEALRAAGLVVIQRAGGLVVSHERCADCIRQADLSGRRNTSWGGRSGIPPGMLVLRIANGEYGTKTFLELKAGGFNLPKITAFMVQELVETHKWHEDAIDKRQGFSSSSDELVGIAERLGLEVELKNWGDRELKGVGGIAEPTEAGTIRFNIFTTNAENAERILALLKELGIARKADGGTQ